MSDDQKPPAEKRAAKKVAMPGDADEFANKNDAGARAAQDADAKRKAAVEKEGDLSEEEAIARIEAATQPGSGSVPQNEDSPAFPAQYDMDDATPAQMRGDKKD